MTPPDSKRLEDNKKAIAKIDLHWFDCQKMSPLHEDLLNRAICLARDNEAIARRQMERADKAEAELGGPHWTPERRQQLLLAEKERDAALRQVEVLEDATFLKDARRYRKLAEEARSQADALRGAITRALSYWGPHGIKDWYDVHDLLKAALAGESDKGVSGTPEGVRDFDGGSNPPAPTPAKPARSGECDCPHFDARGRPVDDPGCRKHGMNAPSPSHFASCPKDCRRDHLDGEPASGYCVAILNQGLADILLKSNQRLTLEWDVPATGKLRWAVKVIEDAPPSPPKGECEGIGMCGGETCGCKNAERWHCPSCPSRRGG